MLAEDSEIHGTVLNDDIDAFEEHLKKDINIKFHTKVVEQPCTWQYPTINHLHKSF
jgi:hypothetical protein